MRHSPDWAALAAEHARGQAIAAARYLPPAGVMHFPAHIAHCIARWNALFAVDFFACRAALRQIAGETLASVCGALVLPAAALPQRLPDGIVRLFFLDDDDWFAPDTVARIADVGEEDVAVFPLPRLDQRVFTFCRRPPPPGVALGLVSRFATRYQTNNYALHRRLCTPPLLAAMADHHAASAEADRLGLRDGYYDVVVSATNKTPVSASVVARIVDDEAGFRRHVERFVGELGGLDLPAAAAWMREPIARTAALFARALG